MATMPDLAASLDANTLERKAAGILADALARAAVLHLPGERDRHRRQLENAIDLASRALAGAAEQAEEAGGGARAMTSAYSTLVQAHAARARDARHGAGQLSLSAQRAPTRAACDDGWHSVEAIVSVAEASALEATRLAVVLDDAPARKAARAAQAAAREARRIVDQRNHAYTFHADPGFSFGEGWYLAAAAVLAGVAIQIEPGQPQTAQAERFLRDAGLGSLLAPHRSRPRANKHLPEIVARAFRADPLSAQRKLRAAFLGDAPVSREIVHWVDGKLAGVSPTRKVLLWVRYGKHHPTRNTTYPELVELARRALATGLVPILVGDAVRDAEWSGEPATGSPALVRQASAGRLRPNEIPREAIDLTLFWKEPIFQGADMRRAQLQFFEHLKQAHGLAGQLGVTTASMDGPALLGLPTMYLTDAPNPRLGTWVAAVPGYREIVRGSGYLDRISDELERWKDGCRSG
jgi:hypothetical protein